MKKHWPTILLILVFVLGLSLMLYPTISDWWNSRHQSRAIAGYTQTVAQLDSQSYDPLWAQARAYNESLLAKSNRYYLDEEERQLYNSLLNVGGNGIMGYVEIPKLDLRLPIYHGTDEAVLQVAIGHIEGTSLPTGGAGTHCVISGHRGLPSARLFTGLDQMEVGDTFSLSVLDRVLTYQVDQILVVLPDDVEALQIDPDADLCTLFTCTPYGVNSHRLLVRGHRVETPDAPVAASLQANAVRLAPWKMVPIVFAALFALVLPAMWIRPRKTRKRCGK